MNETEDLINKSRQLLQDRKSQAILRQIPQGPGSGLNADLLDGLHAEDLIEKFLRELEDWKKKGVPTFGGRSQGLIEHGNEYHSPGFLPLSGGELTGDLKLALGKKISFDDSFGKYIHIQFDPEEWILDFVDEWGSRVSLKCWDFHFTGEVYNLSNVGMLHLFPAGAEAASFLFFARGQTFLGFYDDGAGSFHTDICVETRFIDDLKTNAIFERILGSGVTIDGVHCKDYMVKATSVGLGKDPSINIPIDVDVATPDFLLKMLNDHANAGRGIQVTVENPNPSYELFNLLTGSPGSSVFSVDKDGNVTANDVLCGNVNGGAEIKASDHFDVGGSDGIDKTVDFQDNAKNDHHVVVKGGLITEWTIT